MSDAYSGFDGARVLITGGMGFIGSNLARRLVEQDIYSGFAKARAELGCQPAMGLARGLRQTPACHAVHHEAYWSAS